MFQVAARPTPPHLASNMETYTPYPTQVPVNLQLPRTLQRPTFSEVSRDFVVQLAPELQEVPFEYIRKHLAGQANEMLAALSLMSVPSSLPKSRLASNLDVPLRPANPMPSSTAFPTHILAISSSKSSPSSPTTPTVASFAAQAVSAGSATVPLYPAHALVLAAHCTLLPPLPRSRPSNRATSVTLPVVPLTVPSAETFPLLHAYLHTKRPDNLLAALLPSLAASFPSATSNRASSSSGGSVYVSQFTSERLSRLANSLASTAYHQSGPQGALSGLMAHAKVVNALWRNVCALGVFDPELWGVMDLAWEIILAALTQVAQRSG
ncbi:unnamed protein product [Somion occarium]|uniref:Clp1-like protein n=1 Tax=Somion occarium TaxID=3059160 RepID=A0ABP1DPF8_9APHY